MLRSGYTKAAWIFAATDRNQAQIKQLGLDRVSILPQSGISSDDLLGFKKQPNMCKNSHVKLITGCRLIHWKAVDLTVEAVALAYARGLPVSLSILNDGPELNRLRCLVSRLGLHELVLCLRANCQH